MTEQRLIDANALKNLYRKWLGQLILPYDERDKFAIETCILGLDDAPTIEAEPVKHGRWLDTREFCGDFMCSNCDALYGTNKFNYCPNCGAKMDGGTE